MSLICLCHLVKPRSRAHTLGKLSFHDTNNQDEDQNEKESCGILDPSQTRVLNVIQGLIQHKRQTIATLNNIND